MESRRHPAIRALLWIGRALWTVVRYLLLALFVVLMLVIPIPMAPMFKVLLHNEGQTSAEVVRKKKR